MVSFYFFGAVAVVASLLVIGQRSKSCSGLRAGRRATGAHLSTIALDHEAATESLCHSTGKLGAQGRVSLLQVA